MTPRAATFDAGTALRHARQALANLHRVVVDDPASPTAAPAEPPMPELPDTFVNSRTFVPYYDTEEDNARHGWEALQRQTRELRRAEHEEERATLPRHPRTGRILRPGEADELPTGARLAPLRG